MAKYRNVLDYLSGIKNVKKRGHTDIFLMAI